MTAEDKAQLPLRAQAVLRVSMPRYGRGKWLRSQEHNATLAKKTKAGRERYWSHYNLEAK